MTNYYDWAARKGQPVAPPSDVVRAPMVHRDDPLATTIRAALSDSQLAKFQRAMDERTRAGDMTIVVEHQLPSGEWVVE